METKKVKVPHLNLVALDWAVAQCEKEKIRWDEDEEAFIYFDREEGGDRTWSPVNSWAQAGPIIEREHIAIDYSDGGNDWCASVYDVDGRIHSSAKPLIAAMRSYVEFKMGEEIDVPVEFA